MPNCIHRMVLSALLGQDCECSAKQLLDTVAKKGETPAVGMTGGEAAMTAKEFRSRRKASLLTMEQCAELLGVSLKTVWRWENAKARIDHFKAEAIRAALIPGRGAKPRRMDSLSELEG